MEEVTFMLFALLRAAKTESSLYVMLHIVLMPMITLFQRAEWTKKGWRFASRMERSPSLKVTVRW
jgi:hypothetical protein